MKIFRVRMVIRAKRTDVWNVFTDPKTWESWYGGALERVEPSWQIGATLKWKMGPPSTLLEVNPIKCVRIQSSDMKTTWKFSERGGRTLVEMKKDFGGGHIAVTNPAAQKRECENEIGSLKDYIEKTCPEQTIEATRPANVMLWWKLRQLRSKNPSKRVQAVRKLSVLRDARIVAPLVAAIREADSSYYESHIEAKQALVEIRNSQAVVPLLSFLKDENHIVRETVAEALGNIGDKQAVEPLIDALHDWSNVRLKAIRALGKLGDNRAIEPLAAMLSDQIPGEDIDEGLATVEALELLNWKPRSDNERAWQALLHQNWEEIARLGANGLGLILSILKQWEASQIRKKLLGGLQEIKPELWNSICDNKLIPLLIDGVGGVIAGHMARKTLANIGSPTVPALLTLLSDKSQSEDMRYGATMVLGVIKDSRAIEPLLNALQDESLYVSKRVAEALADIGDKRAVAGLIAQLNDKNSEMRSASAVALGRLGDQQAVQSLVSLLKDDIDDVRRAAIEALEKLGWLPNDPSENAILSRAKERM
jgi:HEAT repeat protein